MSKNLLSYFKKVQTKRVSEVTPLDDVPSPLVVVDRFRPFQLKKSQYMVPLGSFQADEVKCNRAAVDAIFGFVPKITAKVDTDTAKDAHEHPTGKNDEAKSEHASIESAPEKKPSSEGEPTPMEVQIFDVESMDMAEQPIAKSSNTEVVPRAQLPDPLPVSELYLARLKNRDHKPTKITKKVVRAKLYHSNIAAKNEITILSEKSDPDIICEDMDQSISDVEDDDDDISDVLEETSGESTSQAKRLMRVKFLSFHENVRPPYYGTFRKTLRCVSGRRPFGREEELFNYEEDSDEDWEEGGAGEDLNSDNEGSDDEEGGREGDDYEIDNEFFVPHGHLSDEEAEQGDDLDSQLDPESGGFSKQQLLEEREIMEARKGRLRRLKPLAIGCIWDSDTDLKENEVLREQLAPYKAVYCKVLRTQRQQTAN